MPTATEVGAERRLAVLGSPIAHSKSPVLHAAAYRVLGLPWRYEAVDVAGEALAGFVASRDDSWLGLSLTMPLKQTVLPLIGDLDEVARLTGAANTVLFDADTAGERVLRGFNTDVVGIVRALRAADVTTARHVHVFGGGATAASAIVAAAELGAEQVSVAVRTPARAQWLGELARAVGLVLSVDAFGTEPPAVPELVISTLPGSIGATAASEMLRGPGLASAAVAGVPLFDVAYDPWPSPVAAAWRALAGQQGAPADPVVLSGLPMLVHQALLQVRVFVAGDPTQPLECDDEVLASMLAAVDLDAAGRPLGSPADGATPARVPES